MYVGSYNTIPEEPQPKLAGIFEPKDHPGFPDIQKWILICFFHGFSPLIVTEVSKGEFGHWATEHFPTIPGTAREQILRTFSGQALFWECKISLNPLKSLAHPTGLRGMIDINGLVCPTCKNHLMILLKKLGGCPTQF